MYSPRPASIPEDSPLHNPFESIKVESPPHHSQPLTQNESPSTPSAPNDDYASQMNSALGGNEQAKGEEDGEDDEFGAFVYSGKDSDPSTITMKGGDRDYQEQMDEVMGDTGIEKEVEKDGNEVGGVELDTKLGRRVRNTKSNTISQELSTPKIDSDEFPNLPSPPSTPSTPTMNQKRPLASRASYGGSPSPSPAPSSPAASTSTLSHYPRRPSYHPQISRLRSVSTQSYPIRASQSSSSSTPANRFVSSSTYNTAFEDLSNPPTNQRPSLYPSPSTSAGGFDNQSLRSSTSHMNLLDFPSTSDLPNGTGTSASSVAGGAASTASPDGPVEKTIKWSSLKRISARLLPSPPASNGNGNGGSQAAESRAKSAMGTPTVMAVSGIVVVGTTKGWCLVFDFGQNLRCICGTEGIAKESGMVTAVAISQDHTFIAVGHQDGSIHLYSLLKPSIPARSVPPTTLSQVRTGRKEGHLKGTRILHLGFIGARHTAIVSADEMGLSFYHSLGKVLMLASTDIIRMLGNYPDPSTYSPPTSTISSPPNERISSTSMTTPRKKPTTILSMAPLPLGPTPHPPSDSLNLVALLTPTKLVVVGLKPVPRTWWRFSYPRTNGDETSLNGNGGSETGEGGKGYEESGVLGWWPSYRRTNEEEPEAESGDSMNGKKEIGGEVGEDPMLAWAWGRKVRLVRVKSSRKENEVLTKATVAGVEFSEMGSWECDSRVLALKWYSESVIIILTATHVDVFDITTKERIGRDLNDIRSVVSNDFYSNAFDVNVPLQSRTSYAASFTTYKRKLFMLGTLDVRAGAILSWADRILALMQPSTILSAIETTTSYLEGRIDASTITLPSKPYLRRPLVEPKLREILNASLDFVFSEERLRDGSHSDGESTRRLFEGLVGTCVRACHALEDVDWLFDELYERYEENGIEGIFLDRIEPFVLAGSVNALPPSVSQRLIAIHEERRQFEAAQRIIVSVDPELLDLNQALGLCQRHKLYDALIHVYSRAMHDYVAPIVELLDLVRRIARNRRRRPSRIGGEIENGDEEEEEVENFFAADSARRRSSFDAEQLAESLAPDAYKIFAYLAQALVGLAYPRKTPLPFEEAVKARRSIYGFLFSGRTLSWPEKGGKPVLTSDDHGGGEEPTYPYIRLLLRFDAEATLDTLDLAFEDPYLDESTINRQQIVNLLLEIMPPSIPESDFSPVDRTFFHIFVARNLPKYPQYISLPRSTLHEILVSLASDPDQSTIEDRQLAAEYLLSTYTPTNIDEAITLFENAGFFRILRSIYRGERRWASLASTYLRDPDVGADIFDFLRETLKLATRSSTRQKEQLAETILEAVPSLIQADEAGLQRTAELVDAYLPSHHSEVVERLASSHWRQFAYLRCLLEPSHADLPDSIPSSADRSPSARLEPSQRFHYLSLLARHEPQHVIRYLESDDTIAKSEEVIKICEETEAFDAVVWALDKRGETKTALNKVDETLETRTDLLLQRLLQGREEEEGYDEEAEEDEDGVLKGRTAEALLEQIVAISTAATTVCSIRSSGRRRSREIAPEDLWFGLLSSLVSTVRSIRAVVPSPTQPSDRSASSHRRTSNASMIIHDEDESHSTLSPRASELLSSLIPSALSALVSTTSSREVSFPHLVRRLIDSNSRSPAANRSYSEFKSIVSSMLDTYAFEGDLLSLSSKISAQDLFAHVEEYKNERDRGWRPGGRSEGNERGECAECLQPVWGLQGQGSSPPMSRSASVSMVVEQLGMTGRPRMKKRPSLKGKEVDWPELYGGGVNGRGGRSQGSGLQELDPPKGIVISRDGKLYHQSCHLGIVSRFEY